MIHEVFMPALSSTMTEGKIVSWEKSPGDKVEKGETLVVVESDKADMDVESFNEGYLATIMVEAGQEATVGAAIAFIAETEAEIEAAKQKGANLSPSTSSSAPATPAPAPEPVAVTTVASTNGQNGRTVASPRARKLAKQLKVDLKTIAGSGPYGRIIAADVEVAAGKSPTPVRATITAPPVTTPAPTAPTPIPTPAPVAATPGETVAFSTLQKVVTRNMVASLQVPVIHIGYTISTDALDSLYKQIKPKGVTMTALLAKAVALTLKKFPIINASYTDAGIKYNGSINVAVAVAMPDGGLITPVLQNADQLDIYSLSRTWRDLVERSRSKQLQPEEYNSGTFTLSNLGMFGVDRFDAILPPGQGSILAIGTSSPQVVATADGMMGIKRQMQVNMTSDHRIIYGADAAAFLQSLAQLIEKEPQSLTL